MPVIFPPALHPGDTIAIVATARKIERDAYSKAIDIFHSWGYKTKVMQNVSSSFHQFAGTDEERTKGLQDAINDSEVKAVICVRGGYGSLRIIDQIDFSSLEKNPKWIGGYSDITVIHNHLLSQHHIASLHCTMPVNMASNSPEALETFKLLLEGKKPEYEIKAHSYNRPGTSEGVLCGGNLSLICALNGSVSLPDMTGKILFLEDLDEYLYHIDRMMLNLKRSGILKKIAGLVVGGFTGMKDNPVPFGKTAEEIIAEHVSEYNYPVCFGFPAGHMDDNRALMIGGKVKLSVNIHQTLLQFL
ncbi:MAG: S66 peptidase family protein [Bacteroidota bacterium]